MHTHFSVRASISFGLGNPFKGLLRSIIGQEAGIAMHKTSGKIEKTPISEGVIHSGKSGKVMAQDSAHNSAPEGLVLPKPTKTPPKPIESKEE